MGLYFFSSGSSRRDSGSPSHVTNVTVECNKCDRAQLPRPDRYQIVKIVEINNCVIAWINYLDATNYNGDKILVYKCKLEDVMNQKSLDPHFMEDDDYISPIARFVPTDEGWKMAISFVMNFKGDGD